MQISYAPHMPFEPESWQPEFLDCTDPVVLLTGSAGGGKSRGAYEKLHAFCLTFPGAKVIAARKTREDAEKSVVNVLQNDVIGNDDRVDHVRKRFIFEYDNGSAIMYIGMKDRKMREAVRSIFGSVDMILMEEATEFDEEDFDELNLRLRGNAAGWCQLILATNPGPPLHWIKIRLIELGEARVFISHARDNTHNDPGYGARLDTTRGVTRARLRDGLWIAGTGLVIDPWLDDWDEHEQVYRIGNVRPEADFVPGGGPVVLAADDGYAGKYDPKTRSFSKESNPRVFLLVQMRATGFNVFYESYQVKKKVEDQLNELRKHCAAMGWPFPISVDYDKAAAHLEGRFKDFKFRYLRKSPASRDESIKLLRESCDVDINGWRQILVHPRCFMLKKEMSSWSYDRDGNPEKHGDHGPDALRYFNWNAIRGPGKPVDIATDGESEAVLQKMDLIDSIYEKHMEAAGAKLL